MKKEQPLSKQVNIMVDACYNIVKSKNLSISKEERGKKKKRMD